MNEITILRWIRAGFLPAFRSPDAKSGSGKKTFRVFADDWEMFLRSNTQVGTLTQKSPPLPLRVVDSGKLPTGLDGIQRRKSK